MCCACPFLLYSMPGVQVSHMNKPSSTQTPDSTTDARFLLPISSFTIFIRLFSNPFLCVCICSYSKSKKLQMFNSPISKSSYIVNHWEVLFPTHPCRLTVPPSWSTARLAGCSSPPCLRAEPCHRKHPGSGQAAPQMSPDPGEKKGGNWSYQKKLLKGGKSQAQIPILCFLFLDFFHSKENVLLP